MVTLSKLVAYLSLDKSKYEDGLKEASHDAEGLGSKLSRTFGTVAKMTGAAVTAGVAAVGKLAKDVVAAYGEFQQLEGGIQTLFGKDAQTMLDNASKAFKTAGISANQYMEMAIQSSASMISALGGDTQKAAEMMDMSIIDMSDNVNKMGTTMEAVQNAYRGFSRGNFTMLDNLALGYAGTKEGMKELLDRANEINKAHGVMSDYAIDSYADIVEAIHVVQTEMGITGTTAKEAGDTITGSAGSAKAAWEDLKVAMASGDDNKLKNSLDNLIASVTTMAENIIPIFERAITGVGSLIEKVAPIIAERLPGLVENVLPSLLSAATSLVQGVINALPTLLQTLLKALPNLIKQVVATIRKLLPEIKKVIPDLIKAATDILMSLAQELPSLITNLLTTWWDILAENIDTIIDSGLMILEALIDGIMDNLPKLAEAAMKITEKLISTIIERLPEILEKGKDILLAIVYGITENIPKIIQAAVEVIKNLAQTLINNLPQILQAGIQLIIELAKGIFEELPNLIAQIPQIILDLVTALLSPENIAKLIGAGFDMIGKIFEGLFSGDFLGAAWDMITALLGGFLAIPGMIMEIGAKIVGFIFEGIKDAWNGVVDWVESGIEMILGDVNAARDQALAELDAINGTYQSKIEQNRRNYEKYGSAYGITGQESFAGSNTMAEIAKNQSESRRSGSSNASAFAGSESMQARYSTTTIVNVGGNRLAQATTDGSKRSTNSNGGHGR